MVELLKINTPIANKNAIPNGKQLVEPNMPFDMKEVSKVIKPSNQSEIHKQNTGLTQRDSSTILANLMKNPSVTVSFLRNIYMLQEIIKLLPINNQTTIQELRSLFAELFISPEQIVEEMMKQKNTSTVFRGELFDFIRNLLKENPSEEVNQAIVRLLRSINANINREDVLDSIANNLKYLGDMLEPSKSLSGDIRALEAAFRDPNALEQFNDLKNQLFEVVKNIQSSILYSASLEKVVGILNYNLSRFNTNKEFFRDAVNALMTHINGMGNKERFINLVESFVNGLGEQLSEENNSKVITVLSEIIGKQAGDADIKMLSSDTIERIVHSLLSSPCNFTPLLHFVIPVQQMDIKSFAEIWIDPNDPGEEGAAQSDSNIHMLIVFDIEGMGSFEMEIFARNQSLRVSLMCPKTCIAEFSMLENRFSTIIESSSYNLDGIEISPLERPRSLMDVFKTLPYKRTGIDVRI